MQAQHLTIVLDLDGVLADFHGKIVEECGPPVTFGWDFKTWYPRTTKVRGLRSAIAWSRDKPWEKADALCRLPSTYENLQPLPGARKGVRALSQAGHKLYVVTARPGNCAEVTFEWCGRWLPRDLEDVIVVSGWKNKLPILRKINPHIVLDDNAETVLELRKAGLHAVVFNQPWNVSVPPPRVDGWRHFVWAMK